MAYIEKKENVSSSAVVSGNAQVSDSAQVSDNARVSGNARVSDDAQVSDNARVFGDAQVSGNAWVFGDAVVYGNAVVSGNAVVYGNAVVSGNALIEKASDYLVIGPAKSSGRFTTAHRDSKIGVRVNCGCFSGTVKKFSDAIEETHKDNQKHLKQYRAFVSLIKSNFDLE